MNQLFETGRESSAVFSPCRTWRYTLTRTWDSSRPAIAFVGINPSKADETRLDNTTTKCRKWCERDGYGTYIMLNLYGLVSTDPKGLKSSADPIGPENDTWICKTLENVSAVCLCWGATFSELTKERRQIVTELAQASGKPLLCLGFTKSGIPRHPLMLANATQLVPYQIGKELHGNEAKSLPQRGAT